jgi:membrane protein DedA with SNARE-associated domain
MIFVVVGAIILLESMGVPLPGEITLISASLLAATGTVSIWGVAIGAAIGAIVGDSIGYAIGRRGGRPLLERFGRRFPKHFGPTHLARAERVFAKWGVWAVFFGGSSRCCASSPDRSLARCGCRIASS